MGLKSHAGLQQHGLQPHPQLPFGGGGFGNLFVAKV
jgi:hypothetical protein